MSPINNHYYFYVYYYCLSLVPTSVYQKHLLVQIINKPLLYFTLLHITLFSIRLIYLKF